MFVLFTMCFALALMEQFINNLWFHVFKMGIIMALFAVFYVQFNTYFIKVIGGPDKKYVYAILLMSFISRKKIYVYYLTVLMNIQIS